MKNILIAVLLMLAAPLIFAQSLPVGPKSFTGFCLATSGASAGLYVPIATSSNSSVVPNPPTYITLFGFDGTNYDALTCDSTGHIIPGGAASGDLSGTYPGPTVSGLLGHAIPTLAAGCLQSAGTTGPLSWSTCGSGGGGTPGGTSGQVQYNNASAFGGVTVTANVLAKGNTTTGVASSNIDEGVTTASTVTVGATDSGGVAAPVFSTTNTTDDSYTLNYRNSAPTGPSGSQIQLVAFSQPLAAATVDVGQYPTPFYWSASTGAIVAIPTADDLGTFYLPRQAFLEKMQAVAATFNCSTMPTVSLEYCGASAGTCSGSSVIATSTLTAANTSVDSGVTPVALAVGYYTYKFTAGACTVLNESFSATLHSGTE